MDRVWYLCGVAEGKTLRGVKVHWRFQRNQSWQSLCWNCFVLHTAQGEQSSLMTATDDEENKSERLKLWCRHTVRQATGQHRLSSRRDRDHAQQSYSAVIVVPT